MRTYKTVKRKVEDKIYCDVCVENCTTEQLGSEYATLEAIWGYSSGKDGKKYDIHLCENCFDETIEWMTKKRKRFLGCFNYPHAKDPLKGEGYDIL
jgi:hypothetical protein